MNGYCCIMKHKILVGLFTLCAIGLLGAGMFYLITDYAWGKLEIGSAVVIDKKYRASYTTTNFEYDIITETTRPVIRYHPAQYLITIRIYDTETKHTQNSYNHYNTLQLGDETGVKYKVGYWTGSIYLDSVFIYGVK